MRNHNIFPGHIFLSKNSDKTPKNEEIKRYIKKLVNTHILMFVIQ